MTHKFPSILLIGCLLLVSSSVTAEEYETGFKVRCEPVEVSDVTRVIRNRIWNAIEADPDIDHHYLASDIEVIDKHKSILRLSELGKGQGFSFNTSDLSLSIGGVAEGHQCYATAEITINVTVKRLSDGALLSNEVTTQMQIPGAWSTKGRVKNIPVPPQG